MFYQTNKFESTTGGKYHFAKMLSRGSLFEKGVCISTDINFDLSLKKYHVLKEGASFLKK